MPNDYIKGSKYDVLPRIMVQNFTTDKNTNYAINTREDGQGGTDTLRINRQRKVKGVGKGKHGNKKKKLPDR